MIPIGDSKMWKILFVSSLVFLFRLSASAQDMSAG